MKKVYSCFFYPGEVVEIRAIDVHGKSPAWGNSFVKGTVAGYFDNPDAFSTAAETLDRVGAKGVYFTLNPVNPALLARASNRLIAHPKHTTQDNDIVCIRWIPIDMDPVRPAGISSTDEEVKAAISKATAITFFLEEEMGFQKAVRGFSGNGVHLLYRIPDLPNTETNRNIIHQCINYLADRFSDETVDVDRKVVNPARIWKLFGTTGRKGDNTKDRPHRKSFLYDGQPLLLADLKDA